MNINELEELFKKHVVWGGRMKLENTFREGDRVHHSLLGDGTVSFVDNDNCYLTVDFDPPFPYDCSIIFMDFSFFCPDYYGEGDDGLECINELILITD